MQQKWTCKTRWYRSLAAALRTITTTATLEGAGKTIVDESVGVVIGEKYYVEICDESQVLGQFTSVATGQKAFCLVARQGLAGHTRANAH